MTDRFILDDYGTLIDFETRNMYYNVSEELANLLKELHDENEQLKQENTELKASLYAERTNTTEVINNYAKQFKRYSKEFSFMIDLAEDLGVDVSKLEGLND